MNLRQAVFRFLSIEAVHVTHLEKLISALGGALAIAALLLSLSWLADGAARWLLLASMGASAVLLFAVPHGPLSQPWALLGGHVISAFIGVSCAHLGLPPWLAGGLAVGAAIAAMYYLRCIHPPGGATALAAVLAASPPSYVFLLAPVLLNVVLLLLFALAFNNLFPWRRYPSAWRKSDKQEQAASPIAHEDFVYALSQMESFVDIDEDDLAHLYALATRHALSREMPRFLALRPGACYSNGRYGRQWSVRRIESLDQAQDKLRYQTLAGRGRRRRETCSPADFLRWASHEVERDEENWKRVSD